MAKTTTFSSNGLKPQDPLISSMKPDLSISFSHVQLYVDELEDIGAYKELEALLNKFEKNNIVHERKVDLRCLNEHKNIWSLISSSSQSIKRDQFFNPQNRDIVKQLIVGFGFRVTGYRFPNICKDAGSRSVLVTSKDSNGIQIVITSPDTSGEKLHDRYHHFQPDMLTKFFNSHSNHQGIAVLGFLVNDVEMIHMRYQETHPKLVHRLYECEDEKVKILEVFAYYSKNENPSISDEADFGTILRFLEHGTEEDGTLNNVLPGLVKIDADFDESSQAAYWDHWVSNVVDRTQFLKTLEETVGFKPKVNFNAGVVAAGEAQIESTVTGNESIFFSTDKASALKNQSQVYLPINNALSNVGHVHGFLEQIGQGVQHIASRVENLIDFVQRCNNYRLMTGEGFTFLKIPRSYYGVLNSRNMIEETNISSNLAQLLIEVCQKCDLCSPDGAVNLDVSACTLQDILDKNVKVSEYLHADTVTRDSIIHSVLQSRYKNIYNLLGSHVSEETYLGIVRNEILVDVQGDDILYQIFTCNILQRKMGEEAPFLEFIQRVCSECKDENGCPVKIKPGCGGFGIRNFLTLFLSIEVSKAMDERNDARSSGNTTMEAYAQKRVETFTSQLNESNPILNEISEAMTREGFCEQQLKDAETKCDDDAVDLWHREAEKARMEKTRGNDKLMKCSAKYERIMRSLRESFG